MYTARDIAGDPDLFNKVIRLPKSRLEWECIGYSSTGETIKFGPQTFDFPAGYTLAPGATVRIESYTGAVNNPPAVLLWSLGAIWANTGDKAVLYDASSKVIDSACYGSGCP